MIHVSYSGSKEAGTTRARHAGFVPAMPRADRSAGKGRSVDWQRGKEVPARILMRFRLFYLARH